ncbi:MAG: NAD(P)/FAD-dependent oxidoreductase [Myxococcaceae bacterium]|nr:NAD(P)/FAD-dependent oxidoreductase [Myxococcaceae bacterium]
MNDTLFDVLVVGGGPGGLQAALTLGRARKRVLVADGGPRRNAVAGHLNNFVSRDGIAPADFRREARAQLAKYPNVVLRDAGVEAITGSRGDFRAGDVRARRVLLATGMIDQPPAIEGLAPLWGHSVFQCPYCHGWDFRGRRWGYLAPEVSAAHIAMFVLQLRGWSDEVTLFTNVMSDEVRQKLTAAKVQIESADVKRLIAQRSGATYGAPRSGEALGEGQQLEAVELAGGKRVAVDALFMHPPQVQVPLVRSLGLALDDEGFVKVDPMMRETSVPGIYAAGDLTTRLQAAVIAAAAGMQAAAVINAELTGELATTGAL